MSRQRLGFRLGAEHRRLRTSTQGRSRANEGGGDLVQGPPDPARRWPRKPGRPLLFWHGGCYLAPTPD
uniref:Uncharacterized protein n=1 Tax=Arundo donax TaxID=35708 RepID=A0A0A8Z7Y2_ARUDO